MVSHGTFVRSPQRALEKRREDLAQTDRAVIKHTNVFAVVRVKGSGEVLVDVDFPVAFVERPYFTFGAALASNHAPVAGSFPVSSATVTKWITDDRSEQRSYFTGCTLAVVALGDANQKVNIHCVFQGKAFRGPVGTETTVDSGL